MRLSPETLAGLPPDVARPGYDRAREGSEIVHFGIGAFARAHLASYADQALAAECWDQMITGVSLRSEAIANQLGPQDGFYTLTERSGTQQTTRVIGSVREVLVAGRDDEAIIQAIAGECQFVTFTVTEKGYCRSSDGGLDLAAAEASFYPRLTKGLARRKAAGLNGLTLLSCDNLSDNGRQLEALMSAYIAATTPELADWFASECACPNSMVDRIVPATTAADLDALEAHLGLRDEGAVFTESFSQWVIEARFAGNLPPPWAQFGIQIVADVAPYETAKLRMLNGAHSLLAYCGLEAGHSFVHEAIADPQIRELVDALMLEEAATSFTSAAGQDLQAYAAALIARFADRALNHRLAQIAMDGSQKIPQRWLETLAAQQEMSRQCPAILAGLAAWLRHIRDDAAWLNDPLAEQLRDAWQAHGAGGICDALFTANGLLGGTWQPTEQDRRIIHEAL